jgi:hypothetical protein
MCTVWIKLLNDSRGKHIVKVKLSRYRPGQALGGFQEVEALEFLDSRHMKVVRLSALCTGRLYPQKGFLLISVGKYIDHVKHISLYHCVK